MDPSSPPHQSALTATASVKRELTTGETPPVGPVHRPRLLKLWLDLKVSHLHHLMMEGGGVRCLDVGHNSTTFEVEGVLW